MIPVVWYSLPAEGKNIARGYWDQATVERYFAGLLWRTPYTFEHHDDFDGLTGAVVVIPARFHARDVRQINADLACLDWCVVILSSDEESVFPAYAISHPNCVVWTSTPRPDIHRGDRVLGHYLPPQAPDLIAKAEHDLRPLDWWWSGQVNHDRRELLWRQLSRMKGGNAHRTPGFTQGFDPETYYGNLCASKVIPCPSGPATPDSFRLWEALEAGCVPIADRYAPAMPDPGYWDQFGAVPFPIIDQWARIRGVVPEILDDWPMLSVECSAWWQQHKRSLAKRLTADIAERSGMVPAAEQITVIIPTSPIPAHPSLDVITETLASVRAQLPNCDVIITCDGVRPEQADRTADYHEYLRRLMWACNHEWRNVVPIVRRDHGHQGNTTKAALELVDTPLVLFVEHDTPIIGEVPWEALSAAVLSDEARMIRLHHEASILDVHRHLMLDDSPRDVCGAPMIRTRQWSQRPHLAATATYRKLISTYFGAESRTMIEDVMHGVVDHAWVTRGFDGWSDWRVWIYHPDGDMKRSTHLDARGDDPKFERDFVFAYDSDKVPAGAPYPTAWRVD